MKLSYNWLKEYLEGGYTPLQAAEAMTAIGIETDAVSEREQVPGGLAGVVVAQVRSCRPHPDSDHLHVTQVDDGGPEPLDVVCGAPNVAAGQKVLFARIGAVLPGNFKIRKSKIRGVVSCGMICAEDELGIGSGHEGILVLPDTAVVGTPAKDWLRLETEAVIDYEITANRVDAASHFGVARDLYAYFQLNGLPCTLHRPTAEGYRPGKGTAIPVEVLDPEGIPGYTGITVRGVKVGPSPEWLRRRLESIGVNTINNIVDISNYLLFESGQPLHIFDADKIEGGRVVVRRARSGERLVTLDGVERELRPEDLVIADTVKPLCIAGVFGGLDSGVTDQTVNLFIESANFNPSAIRKTARAHGLQTDASYRFERGTDPAVLAFAGRRAAAMVVELAGGETVGEQQEVYAVKAERKRLTIDYDRMEAFIGKRIGRETIERILSLLDYDFLSRTETGAEIAIPSYMPDVTRECDVVEEVLRIYGYDRIELPARMKMSVSPSPSPDPEAVRNYISDFLAANGFVETMNNSLTAAVRYSGLETFPEERCVRLVNPLSSDLNVLRQTLLLDGLEVIAYNLRHQANTLRTFEYGSVYQRLPEGDGTTLASYEEHPCFGLFMTGNSEKSWEGEVRKGSYFRLKAYLELLWRRYGVDGYSLDTESAPADLFSDGLIYRLPGGGRRLAVIGTVLPALARRFEVKQPVFAAEIDFKALMTLVGRVKVRFRELPRFPEVRRDLALLIDEEVRFADLRRSAFRAAKKLLRSVSLFDVYRGDRLPPGKKQYALALVFQDPDKTLTDNEVERTVTQLLSVFGKEYGAILR